MQTIPNAIEEIKEELETTSDSYGTFGCVVRMQDEFDRLKTLFEGRRRVRTTKAIHSSLKRIATSALLAMSLEGEDHASADKR